jgi:hypothetical protein
MYKKALEVNPEFDVALANIANLIKDSVSHDVAFWSSPNVI